MLKKKKKALCNCNYCIFFSFYVFTQTFHYFDYKTWPGNKKTRGSFNQIDVGFDSDGVCRFVAALFLVKTFWFYDNHATSK